VRTAKRGILSWMGTVQMRFIRIMQRILINLALEENGTSERCEKNESRGTGKNVYKTRRGEL